MIKVDKLTYTYPGSKHPVLKDLSFEVGKGEIFGFLGPSGAGKSTTQNVLIGLLRGFEGSVSVNEVNPAKAKPSFFEKIGVAFELPNLYLKLTARENLELFGSFFSSPTRDPDELLKLVGLEGDRDTRVEAFSKGMKMRLNFIRALLNRPEMLFLDEPTSGLDPGNARIMKDIILGLRENGVSIFLTTHNMADADELCSRIAFMVDGTLPVIDSTENLKLKHGRKLLRVHHQGEKGQEVSDFKLPGLSANQAFQDLIKEKEILTIHTLEASLEEIFLKVTGQQLRR